LVGCSGRRAALGGASIAAVVCLCGPALGQTQSPEDLAMARALGTEGVRLADAGECGSAIPKLAAAEKLYHAPTTLERLGECEIGVGKLVSGTERLNQVLREPLPPGAPPAFQTARKRAQDALGPALARIAKLRIHVDGASADAVTVAVDGAPMPSALLDTPRPTDPGTHQITATAPGFLAASATVNVPDGGNSSASLTLALEPQVAPPPVAQNPAPPAPSPAPPPPAASAPPPPPPQGSANVPAIVSFIAGGVGVAVGSIFGVLALGSKSTLDGECGSAKQTCAPSDVSALSTNAWVSNVGFGVGIVGAALGTYFVVTHHRPDAGGPTAAHVEPWIGLGSAGLGGTFQ
jgi:hypothetical protein